MRADGGVATAPATFVVIGGGETGSFYVRQLLRAERAGALRIGRLVVVDRDPAHTPSLVADPRVSVAISDWADWLDRHVLALNGADQLVPYHWAPHLLVGWLEREAVAAGGRAARGGAVPPRGLPMERETRAGDRALSYATWLCPPTCIEPALCPHTRGPKHWSLAGDLRRLQASDRFDAAIVFPSFHLAYGVATIPIADLHAARSLVISGLARGARRYLVSTSSHCHALATVLTIERG